MEIFSDGSDRQVGEASFVGENVDWDTVFKAALSEAERGKSSTNRELCGIKESLLANGEG